MLFVGNYVLLHKDCLWGGLLTKRIIIQGPTHTELVRGRDGLHM